MCAGGVAGNPSCPPEALARLAKDKSRDVRKMAAKNSSRLPKVPAKLVMNGDSLVSQTAATNPPNYAIELMRRTLDEARQDTAENQVHPTSPSPEPAGRTDASFVDELERLAKLHREGALGDEEFAAAKRKLLGA